MVYSNVLPTMPGLGQRSLVIRKCADRRLYRRPLLVTLLALHTVDLWAMEGERVSRTSSTTFDTETLRARGIDPQVAEYFRQAPRFREGAHPVTLVVNGVKHGLIEARFDPAGQLCLDRPVLERAKLRVPASMQVVPQDGTGSDDLCHAFARSHPATQIELDPARREVALLVPAEALQPSSYDHSSAVTGGVAGLFNYDILGQSMRSDGQLNRYLYASTEVGMNAGDWIVRSRQLHTDDGERARMEHLFAYAQRTFPRFRAVFQAGQISISSSLFAGAAVSGVQVMPEGALMAGPGGPAVEGMVQADARIDVRQAGALIYSTRVPAGPFSLTDLPLLNGRNNLEVTVVESGAAERSFTVPLTALNASTLPHAGFSFAAGKVRNPKVTRGDQPQPWVATATRSWALSRGTVASFGILGGNNYQAVATSVDTKMSSHAVLSASGNHSASRRARGTQARFAANVNLVSPLTLGVSATYQNAGYRDLLDGAFGDAEILSEGRYKRLYTGTLSWSDLTWGAFNLSYSSVKMLGGSTRARLVSSWGKSFERATLSASIEALMDSSGHKGAFNADSAFHLNVSIPLGPRSLGTYTRRRDGRTRTGAALSEKLSDQVNYRVAAEVGESASAVVALTPRYTQLNLGYSHYGSGNASHFGQLRGGVVLHGGNVIASPYPVQGTFGILSVGDLSGVKVATPYGPVWTDRWGKAVIAHLPAYKLGRVEVATSSLPRNVDITNGFKLVEAGRGSVSRVRFDIVKTRRVLVIAKDDQGRLLEKGALVIGPDNAFLTTVVDGGQLFLADVKEGQELRVIRSDGTQCRLKMALAKGPGEGVHFEHARASCHAL